MCPAAARPRVLAGLLPGPAKNWRLPTLPSKTLTSTWVRSLFTPQPGPGPSPAPDQHTGFLPREQREERLEEKRAGFLLPQPPDPGWWHASLVTRSAGSNPSYTHHTPIIPGNASTPGKGSRLAAQLFGCLEDCNPPNHPIIHLLYPIYILCSHFHHMPQTAIIYHCK